MSFLHQKTSRDMQNNSITHPIKSIKKLFEIKHLHDTNISCITSLSPNKFATGAWDGSLCIFHLKHSLKKYEIIIHYKQAHDNFIYYLNKILQKNQLISCSDDKTIKLWEIIEEQTNYLTLKRIFKGHTDWILQVISIPNDNIISCSYDGSIRLWSCLSFQEQTTFYQKQYKPWGILCLSKNNKFVFSYTYEYNGFIMIYESNTPHQFIKVIDGVYGWWYGMIELNDGNFAVSQEKPNRICIIDSIKYEIVYDLRNEEFIKSIGALEKLNCYSFLFIWKGEILQIGTINGKEYEIQYINKDEKDVNGVSGIVIEEEEKYFITCNRNGNHGLNIYKFEV